VMQHRLHHQHFWKAFLVITTLRTPDIVETISILTKTTAMNYKK
jgi:hypothetical protein